jgi:hypothetical protein
MNNRDTEKALSILEDKCVTKVEENFNLYLLNDISEVGEVIELFTNVDWYLYYSLSAMELYSLMNNLLLDAEANKEYLLRSISLKRVIDEKLIFYAKSDQEIVTRIFIGSGSFLMSVGVAIICSPSANCGCSFRSIISSV